MSAVQEPEVEALRPTKIAWTTDPAPFIAARADEDHRAADELLRFLRTLSTATGESPGAVADGPGIHVQDEPHWDGSPGPVRWVPMLHRETEAFTARYHPDRAQLDAASRHCIARLHRATEAKACRICVVVEDGRPIPVAYPCMTLRALTWPYADHPDYDTTWDDEDDYGWDFGQPS